MPRAQYSIDLVEGTVDVTKETVRVQLRLIDGMADRKSFIQEIEGTRSALPELERRVAAAIEEDVTRNLTPARR